MIEPLGNALASLPHGKTFRFIDRLLTLKPGESATGEYTLTGQEPWLAGHFPGEPLLPGVLLVEAAAQLAGIVAQSQSQGSAAGRLRLTALRQVKILGTSRPGETILLEARLIQRLGNLILAEATATLAGRTILQAQLTLSAESPL